MTKKLHIGCGSNIIEGWINLDFVEQKGVDVVWDLNKFPWPFKYGEIDEIFTSHTLEHIDNLQKTMREIHRICKKNAKVKIRVPHFSCGVYYRDPTHKRPFSYFSFDYFTSEEQYERVEKGMFEVFYRRLNFTRLAQPCLNIFFNPVINLSPAIYERFFCWLLPASEMLFILKVNK